jgi:hypothetical protein
VRPVAVPGQVERNDLVPGRFQALAGRAPALAGLGEAVQQHEAGHRPMLAP